MDAYVLDWVNLLLRWAHVIVAIAWIGSSFYFVFLDNSLTPPTDPVLREKGVGGELWAVHGGGFYHPQKYTVSPKTIPETPALVLLGELLDLADRLRAVHGALPVPGRRPSWSTGTCTTGRRRRRWPRRSASWSRSGWSTTFSAARSASAGAATASSAWRSARSSSSRPGWPVRSSPGRAAFLLVGRDARHGDERQRLLLDHSGPAHGDRADAGGQPVDPIHGQRAKQRSVHNTYFTLPVLVAMLSNHYGFLFGAAHNWLVLSLLMLAGALIRHSFVVRHQALVAGRRVRWEYAIAGTLLIIGLAIWMAPTPRPDRRQRRAGDVRAGPGGRRPTLRDVPQRPAGEQGRAPRQRRRDRPARPADVSAGRGAQADAVEQRDRDHRRRARPSRALVRSGRADALNASRRGPGASFLHRRSAAPAARPSRGRNVTARG